MTTSPPLTKHLGKAERTLQELLSLQLKRVDLTFPEWTVLTFLNGAGRLENDNLLKALSYGKIVDYQGAGSLITSMIAKGLIESQVDGVAITPLGKQLYLPVRSTVETITASLVHGISTDDIEATQRTLEIVTQRAANLINSSAI